MRLPRMLSVAAVGVTLCFAAGCTSTQTTAPKEPAKPANIRPNVVTSFNPTTETPVIAKDA
ncbi:hypothetical protein [Thermodesulfitimonas sp.]